MVGKRFLVALVACVVALMLPGAAFAQEALDTAAASYDNNAVLYDTTTSNYQGVYTVELSANTADAANAPTIGIPSIADATLADAPTTESPAIIQGAAVGYETKTGAVEYAKIKDRVKPYSEFTYQIVEEQAQDGTMHKKLTGFDGTYVIVRLEVSKLFEGVAEADLQNSYLHMKQEDNNALLVAIGMVGDNAFVGQPTLADGTVGNVQMTGAYSYNALKEENGKRYVDIILFSTASIVSGADVGQEGALNGDVKLSFYVDQTATYNDAVWDETSQDTTLVQKCLDKFYSADAASTEGLSHFLVKGSDLALETMVENSGGTNKNTGTTYWSLTKALLNAYYDQEADKLATNTACGRTVKLMCEVPIIGNIPFAGTSATILRKRTLDVNSFDIQIANNTQTDTAGFTLQNAWLKLEDKSATTGAEMAIGNNARFVINSGGKLIIDKTCQLEIEWDGATTTPTSGQEQASSTTLNNGILDLNSGGELVNNGVITIEGTEGKPYQPGTQPAQEKGYGELTVEQGATLTNNGAMLVYGRLYNMGTLANKGKYSTTIDSNDPDQGAFSYHCGILVAWKDDVTQPNVTKGALLNGADATGKTNTKARLTNSGDIVLRPGELTNYGTISNAKDASHIYVATATDAIIPIEPTTEAPTVVTKRIALSPPEGSVVTNKGTITNGNSLTPASVELLDNTGFGAIKTLASYNNSKIVNTGTITADTIKTLKVCANSNLKVTWAKTAGATAYVVSYRVKGATKWKTTRVTGKTSVVLKSLKAYKKYQVMVTAKSGTTVLCASSVKLSGKTTPSTSIKKLTIKSGKKMRVLWSKVTKAKKYVVYYRVKGKTKWKTKTVTAKHHAVTLKKLKKGKKYQVRVVAKKDTTTLCRSSIKLSKKIKA